LQRTLAEISARHWRYYHSENSILLIFEVTDGSSLLEIFALQFCLGPVQRLKGRPNAGTKEFGIFALWIFIAKSKNSIHSQLLSLKAKLFNMYI